MSDPATFINTCRCGSENGRYYEIPGWLIWGCYECLYQELHQVKNQEELAAR